MQYIKRGLLVSIVFLLAVSIAFAAHSSSVSTDYIPIYETTSGNFSVTVSNSLLSQNSINNVTAALNGFNLLSTFSLVGWQSASSTNLLSFFTADHKISNWGSQTFGFSVKADNVDSNQTFDWAVDSYDTSGAVDEKTIQVLIINDGTPPIISNILPVNNSFIKKGTTSQQFSFDAFDSETGVSDASGAYGLCGNLSNSISFAKSNDSYIAEEDLSSYDDSNVLCYQYSAKNNGGETATMDGQFTIDGVPPSVSLIFPGNGVFMNNNSLFQFSATDNLAPTIGCTLYADSAEQGSAVVNNGESANVSVADLADGEHSWNVSCSDLAGNLGFSETRNFILDKTPPLINVTSPANGAVNKAGIPVNVEVSDNYGVASVWYEFQGNTYSNLTGSFSVDTENATDGENHIIIHAVDLAGNEAVLDYVMIVDRQAPSIVLSFPIESGNYDVHVPFVLTATDNYDSLMDCSVISDGVSIKNFTAENGNDTRVNAIILPGLRTVSVQCKDDSDNIGQTSDIAINVSDMSGPDIAMDDIKDITRGETAVFNAAITDVSGVDSASGLLFLPDGSSESVSLSRNGDVFSGNYPTTTSSQLGIYTLVITAVDTIGNMNNATQDFNVVHSYVVTLDVTSPVYEGESVRISGTAARDDGDAFAGNVIVALPGEENRTLALDNNSFSTSITAPAKGVYTIVAWIFDGDRVFSADKILDVREKQKSGGHGGGGSSGGGHSTVVMNESGNSGILTPECKSNSDCKEGQECKDGKCVSIPQEVIAENKSKEQTPAENVSEAAQSNETAVGVGAASGWFNLNNIAVSNLIWILVGIAVVAAIIKLLSSKGKNKGFNFSEIERHIESRKKISR